MSPTVRHKHAQAQVQVHSNTFMLIYLSGGFHGQRSMLCSLQRCRHRSVTRRWVSLSTIAFSLRLDIRNKKNIIILAKKPFNDDLTTHKHAHVHTLSHSPYTNIQIHIHIHTRAHKTTQTQTRTHTHTTKVIPIKFIVFNYTHTYTSQTSAYQLTSSYCCV